MKFLSKKSLATTVSVVVIGGIFLANGTTFANEGNFFKGGPIQEHLEERATELGVTVDELKGRMGNYENRNRGSKGFKNFEVLTEEEKTDFAERRNLSTEELQKEFEEREIRRETHLEERATELGITVDELKGTMGNCEDGLQNGSKMKGKQKNRGFSNNRNNNNL